MEAVGHLLAAIIKIGVTGTLIFVGFLYTCYALESHCINPMGCKPSGPEAVRAAENDRILQCWSRNQYGKDCK